MKDIDVLRELEVKNKEIYLNKLSIDIDNNFEVLKLTIDNMFALFTSDLINKVLEIENSIINKDDVSKQIEEFLLGYKTTLLNLLINRKKDLLSELSQIENENYASSITSFSNQIIMKMLDYYNANVIKYIEDISIDYDDFSKRRLNDYLKDTYGNQLNMKIKQLLDNTNMILVNNYQESYQKYLDLNEKTLKPQN